MVTTKQSDANDQEQGSVVSLMSKDRVKTVSIPSHEVISCEQCEENVW